jgi:hypothetical protein
MEATYYMRWFGHATRVSFPQLTEFISKWVLKKFPKEAIHLLFQQTWLEYPVSKFFGTLNYLDFIDESFSNWRCKVIFIFSTFSYLAWPSTIKIRLLTSFHHILFIPLCFYLTGQTMIFPSKVGKLAAPWLSYWT